MPFPGNVRELRHAIERALGGAGDFIARHPGPASAFLVVFGHDAPDPVTPVGAHLLGVGTRLQDGHSLLGKGAQNIRVRV